MIQFSFTRSEDGTETIVLMGAQGVRVIPDSHANYLSIRGVLLDQGGNDGLVTESDVYALADAAQVAIATLSRLSERVMIKGDTIYFDGDPVESRLTRHIVDMIRAGDDNFGGYVAFLENLQANPSRKSRKGLFRFLDQHNLTITPDGQFVAFKGVALDGRSITAGNEDVTITLTDGTIEVHRGHIPNPLGAVVEMPRSLVDPDRNMTCSVGLHVANERYAQQWGQRMLTITVNPRDVVEVPSDSNSEKIRVHRYTVVGEGVSESILGTSFDPASRPEDDPEARWESDGGADDDWDYEDPEDDGVL